MTGVQTCALPISVILNAPPVLRFTASTDPQRHLYAARLLGVDTSEAKPEEAGDLLANEVIRLMQATGMPNGLSAVGFSESDIEQLVAGTMQQQRLTKLSPRPATEQDLGKLFAEAMRYW